MTLIVPKTNLLLIQFGFSPPESFISSYLTSIKTSYTKGEDSNKIHNKISKPIATLKIL